MGLSAGLPSAVVRPRDVLDALLAHMKASHEAENRFHLDAIAGLRREQRIAQDEYDRKARELKERQAEIAVQIEQHQDGEATFRTTLASLISVASRAADIFERSKIEQNRQLLAFVFSNLTLRGKKLEYSMRSPFDLMVGRADYAGWLCWQSAANLSPRPGCVYRERTGKFGRLGLRQGRGVPNSAGSPTA
jgi:hypothetical protein